MAVVLAYLILVLTVGVAHHLSSDGDEPSLSVGLAFPVIAVCVVAWLLVEVWDALRVLARNWD